MRQNKIKKKFGKFFETDDNLKTALSKLRNDGIELKLQSTTKGDNYFVIRSKSLETKIGANDLGFWLVEQISKNGN